MNSLPRRTKGSLLAKPKLSEGAEKEVKIKELIALLSSQGLQVRRERLKQGHGWRTVSGACRLSGSNILFVDRKLPLDEQLLFLSGVARELKLVPVSAGSSHVEPAIELMNE